MYEKIKEAGYIYLKFDKERGQHLLFDKDTKHVEFFSANKNFAGWGLIYKNTHLEFCESSLLPCDDYNFAKENK